VSEAADKFYTAMLDMSRAGVVLTDAVGYSLDNTYRVDITTKGVDVVSFGMCALALPLEGHYDTVDDLPQWMQDKLAVLVILHPPPPVTEIPGVGRRMGDNLYWVYHDG
jgi:hypothetical protein